jgi:UDP-glucose 4-epimerase
VKNSARRVLFFSSAGVYGVPTRDVVDETHATNPISAYGAAKLTCEKYLQVARHLHGLEYVIVRPSSIYGPGQDPNRRLGVINIFINKILRGQPVVLRVDGSSLRDYLFISDAALVIARAALADETANGIFNIGAERGYTLQELVDEIAQTLALPVAITREPPAKFEIPRMMLDAARAREALGWQPRVPLREGILRTAGWLRTLRFTP